MSLRKEQGIHSFTGEVRASLCAAARLLKHS